MVDFESGFHDVTLSPSVSQRSGVNGLHASMKPRAPPDLVDPELIAG
jgi:hypothetical protein